MSKLFNYKLIFIRLAKVIAFSALGTATLTLLFIFYEAKTQKESILSLARKITKFFQRESHTSPIANLMETSALGEEYQLIATLM